MSISTEINRIKSAKTALKDAINAKGGNLTTELLDAYADAVISLPSGGDIDLTGVTVTADKLLDGVVAVNGEGLKVTGTIKTVSAAIQGDYVVVPAGFHTESMSFPVTVGDIDLTGVTVKADKLLAGVVAIDVTGSKVTGTIPSVSASVQGENVIVPAGFHEQEQSFPVSGGVNLSAVTVTASDILAGKIAVNSEGQQITGTIQTVFASKSGNVVTVPAGFHSETKTFDVGGTTVDLSFVTAAANDILAGKIGADKNGNPVNGTIQNASVSVEKNVVTISAGHLAEGEEITVGTAKSAETITPSTADKTIASGTYLTGALTIKGDENLVPENIAEGVSIFGVEGSHTGGGGADFYRCVSVDNDTKTWSGYKAVLNSGIYSFEETATTGLKFNALIPRAGKIYTADALAVISYLFAGLPAVSISVPLSGDYYGTMNNVTINTETGANGNLSWADALTHVAGEKSLAFDGESYLDLTNVTTTALIGDFTLALGTFLINPERRHGIISTDEGCHFAIDTHNNKYNLWVGTGDYWDIQADWDDGSGYYGGGSIPVKNATVVQLIVTRKGDVWKLFVNGELSVTAKANIAIQADKTLRLGRISLPWGEGDHYAIGRMQKFSIYPEAIDDNEVDAFGMREDLANQLGKGPYDIYDAGTVILTLAQQGQPSKDFTKTYDGWALAGRYEGINANGMMQCAILVSKDEYSCKFYMQGLAPATAGTLEYHGTTYYYNYGGWPIMSLVNDRGTVELDAFNDPVAAVTELLDRHFHRYVEPDLSNCDLYIYRAGLEWVNGKWKRQIPTADEGEYIKIVDGNSVYHIRQHKYGGYWYIYDYADPDMPLYAACKWDDATGEYVPTPDITGPWITMMGQNPPPKVVLGKGYNGD